jgi:putative transposase
MSQRRACGLVGLRRSVARYRPRPRDDGPARRRLRELAGEYRRYGYLRLHILLRNEGLVMNRKRTYRLYREENLSVRRRGRRRLPRRERQPILAPGRRNQVWAINFVSDALWTGRRFRSLVIVDAFSKESPAILPEFSISGARIARLLDELAVRHGLPEAIASDNGPEFTSKAMFLWSRRTGVKLRFIDPGKPIQNAFAESIIGKFRDECLERDLVRRPARGQADHRGLAYSLQRAPAAQLARLPDAGPVRGSRRGAALAGRLRAPPARRDHPTHETNRNAHPLSGPNRVGRSKGH